MTNTQTSKLENGTEITIQGAHSDRSYRRAEFYAHLDRGIGWARATLTISATDDFSGYYVRWSVDRGNGWGKAYRRSGFATEAQARIFASEKFAALVELLATCTAKASTWQPDFTCHR